jgi:hypothetical protein
MGSEASGVCAVLRAMFFMEKQKVEWPRDLGEK